MNDDIWPWIILAVVVILVIALVAMMMKKRKTEHQRVRAQELRSEASGHTDAVHESELRAREKQAEAERARVEAERKEREATQASQGLDQDRALQEDKVREADHLDPDVDHRAEDYEPRTDTLGRSDHPGADNTGHTGTGSGSGSGNAHDTGDGIDHRTSSHTGNDPGNDPGNNPGRTDHPDTPGSHRGTGV